MNVHPAQTACVQRMVSAGTWQMARDMFVNVSAAIPVTLESPHVKVMSVPLLKRLTQV